MKPGCSSELQEIEASDAQLFQIKVLMFSVFHPISCFFFLAFCDYVLGYKFATSKVIKP